MSGSVSLINGHIDPDTNRLTDKEIKKALECCVNWGSTTSCADCPLCNTGCVHFSKLKETLDLINRQQARIKELEERCNNK